MFSTLTQPSKGGDFLNPKIVQKYGKLYTYGCYCKVVTIYNSGIDKVCPNPNNRTKCESIEDQYNIGIYVSKQQYILTKEQLEDSKFWN